MFDRLVESEPLGARKNRSRYFLTSSLFIAVLSFSAIVISIFASDYGIGAGGIELAELIAPVEMAAPNPDPPRAAMPKTQTASPEKLPTRQAAIQNIAEAPKSIPTVSVAPQTQRSEEHTSELQSH